MDLAKRKVTSQRTEFRFTKKKIAIFGVIAALLSGAGYLGWNSLIPANGSTPVLGFANNHFIKATHSASGYHYISMSSGSVKGLKGSGGGSGLVNPTYALHKGELESIHVITEDNETHSKHNFNIDEFNVHTRDLGNFESQTVSFVADKEGTFDYYCSLHPEMRGQITVK